MNKQSEYWKKNVLSWEHGAYYKNQQSMGKVRLLDRLSSVFRGDSIYQRSEDAFELLKDKISAKDIVDVGCASGRLLRRMLVHGADNATGIDVSPEALQLAEKLSKEEGLSAKTKFLQQDVTQVDSKLPSGFLTISLGVIEYFDEQSLLQFLRNLNSDYYFLSFPIKSGEKRSIFRTFLRSIYLKLQHCPGIYFYSLDEFKALLEKADKSPECQLVSNRSSLFITNLDFG